jgi:hypothetical protein
LWIGRVVQPLTQLGHALAEPGRAAHRLGGRLEDEARVARDAIAENEGFQAPAIQYRGDAALQGGRQAALRVSQRHVYLDCLALVLYQLSVAVIDVIAAQRQPQGPNHRYRQHDVPRERLQRAAKCRWRCRPVEDKVARRVPVSELAQASLPRMDVLGRVLAWPTRAPARVQVVASRWLQIRLSRHPKQRAMRIPPSVEGF